MLGLKNQVQLPSKREMELTLGTLENESETPCVQSASDSDPEEVRVGIEARRKGSPIEIP